MKNSRQSGQAMLELLFLLIGFVSLFLGLVFVCGLSDGDIGIFLKARNNAELLASDSKSSGLDGLEFGAVKHGSYNVYGKNEELVFSPLDYTGRSANNTINLFPSSFYSAKDSVLSNDNKDYTLQAEMKEWKDFRPSGNGLFKADFVTDLTDKNALDAASLVSAVSTSQSSVTTIPGEYSRDFYSGLATWLGLRISGSTLRNASGNRVYMPIFSRGK